MRWFSRSTLKPKNWNAYRQLIKAGFGTDLVIHRRMNDDINFRYEVNKAFSEVNIARQLRSLREREGTRLTQAQLAVRTEMKQSRISELEGMNYSSGRSISTLERLAKGLGMAFYYSFITWDELIAKIKDTPKQRVAQSVEISLEPARPLASQLAYGQEVLRRMRLAASGERESLKAHERTRTPVISEIDPAQRQIAIAGSLSYESIRLGGLS